MIPGTFGWILVSRQATIPPLASRQNFGLLYPWLRWGWWKVFFSCLSMRHACDVLGDVHFQEVVFLFPLPSACLKVLQCSDRSSCGLRPCVSIVEVNVYFVVAEGRLFRFSVHVEYVLIPSTCLPNVHCHTMTTKYTFSAGCPCPGHSFCTHLIKNFTVQTEAALEKWIWNSRSSLLNALLVFCCRWEIDWTWHVRSSRELILPPQWSRTSTERKRRWKSSCAGSLPAGPWHTHRAHGQASRGSHPEAV